MNCTEVQERLQACSVFFNVQISQTYERFPFNFGSKQIAMANAFAHSQMFSLFSKNINSMFENKNCLLSDWATNLKITVVHSFLNRVKILKTIEY